MRRHAIILAVALGLGAAACGDDDESDLCPEPTQSIVGPSEGRPALSLVPECKRPDAETMVLRVAP